MTRKLFNDCKITNDESQPVKLVDVSVDTLNKTYIFIFAADKLITSDYYQEILTNLRVKFCDVKITLKFTIADCSLKNIDNNKIINYLQYFRKIDEKIDGILHDVPITVTDDAICLQAVNEFKKNFIVSNIDLLQNYLAQIGLPDVKIEVKAMAKEKVAERVEELKAKQEEKIQEIAVDTSNRPRALWGDDITSKKPLKISEVIDPQNMLRNVTVEGVVYEAEIREFPKSALLTFSIADEHGTTITCKSFTGFMNKPPTYQHLASLKTGMVVKVSGQKEYDKFVSDEVITVTSVLVISNETPISNRKDESNEKRVELHLHSNMSKNNGVGKIEDYFKLANYFGHKSVGITDHYGVESFVSGESYGKKYNIKPIYGVEATIIDDPILCFNSNEQLIADQTFVVFDLESTGLSANMNQIIEIGASKVKNGMIIDSYQTFVKIDEPLSPFITELTGITDEDLKMGIELKDALLQFRMFIKDCTLVAHNATFDLQFLNSNYLKTLNVIIENPVIDTLQLSRFLSPERTYHTLKIISKLYNVKLDSSEHHRADYDALKTAEMFIGMMDKFADLGLVTLNDLNAKNNINKSRGNHVLIYAKTQESLTSLYELVSISNTITYHLEPRILRSDIERLRDQLIIISSGCKNGEIIDGYLNKTEPEFKKLFDFYDFIEILPPPQYCELIANGTFTSFEQIETMHKRIIEITNSKNILVVGNGNAHYTEPNLSITKEILLSNDYRASKVSKNSNGVEVFTDKIKFKSTLEGKVDKIRNQFYKTTDELLADFNYLGEDLAREIVIKNTNIVADMTDELVIVPEGLSTPEILGVDNKMETMAYEFAHKHYGNPLPNVIEERLSRELKSIIQSGYSVVYYISHKLVKHSLEAGYLVGSRGSVGSSVVATFMEITEVNPLPPHYVCPHCQYSEFVEGGLVSSGFDLPKKMCPNCQTNLHRDGQDIPFETFLGFEGDKVPDIDLNFSGEFQEEAFEFVRSAEKLNDNELFDVDHAFRAGTISTMAEKTAYACTANYFDLIDKNVRKSDIAYISKELNGIKRTTGQHPGGIIVVPKHQSIYEFTPVGYPADDVTKSWRTTHFDFHSIHDNLLKLDILGHDDPTMLKRLEELTQIDPKTVDIVDEKVMGLFSGTESIGITEEQILCELGTQGIPEFGTSFVMEMLKDTKPKTFGELIQISGLSHGTNVWLGNAKDLIDSETCELKQVIGCRDDIMVYLVYQGLEPADSFRIMEKVRKGKGVASDDIELMRSKNVPEWYIDSCQKIAYMFPKAHAVAYVLMALRIGYYKVYHPLQYYCAYFSSRVSDFDAPSMIRGSESLTNKIEMLTSSTSDLGDKSMSDVKRKNILNSLKISLEMVERGFSFMKFDLNLSMAKDFVVSADGQGLIMPFIAIEGLGEKEAQSIVDERKKSSFMTIEDFRSRTGLKKKSFEQLEIFGVFENLEETNQVTLF